VVSAINEKLVGWSNYFCLGPVSAAYQAIDRYTTLRLHRWLSRKHKRRRAGWHRFSNAYLHEKLGLVRLGPRTRDLPWANA
jgi:RNA-directed DNA polymerase